MQKKSGVIYATHDGVALAGDLYAPEAGQFFAPRLLRFLAERL